MNSEGQPQARDLHAVVERDEGRDDLREQFGIAGTPRLSSIMPRSTTKVKTHQDAGDLLTRARVPNQRPST